MQELAKQLEHLEAQAEVATRYRELRSQSQAHAAPLWLLRQQDAANQRARLTREMEQLAVELEAETARLRELESGIEQLRARPLLGVSDTVHAAQGALYEVNAETARLEQALAHLRDSRRRVEKPDRRADASEREGSGRQHRQR